MEYADAGSALTIMMQLKKPFNESHIQALAFQVCKGLEYLHLQDPPIVHRDVKVSFEKKKKKAKKWKIKRKGNCEWKFFFKKWKDMEHLNVWNLKC